MRAASPGAAPPRGLAPAARRLTVGDDPSSGLRPWVSASVAGCLRSGQGWAGAAPVPAHLTSGIQRGTAPLRFH